MVSFKNNKKGNAVLDTITIIVVLVVMGIALLFGNYVLDEVNTDIQSDEDMSTEGKVVTGNMLSNYSNLFDNLFLFAFVLFVIFVITSVFVLDTHPIFFAVSVILLIFVFVVAGLLANVYNDVAQDDTIATYANEFTYMTWVMTHLLEVMIGIGFFTAIALFAKFKQ